MSRVNLYPQVSKEKLPDNGSEYEGFGYAFLSYYCNMVQMLEETIRQLKEDNTQIRARVEIETQVQNIPDWLLTETSPTDFRRRLLSLFPTEFQQMRITDQESQTDLFRHKSVGTAISDGFPTE
ncbi:hypothetical protein Tco_1253801 [Tanacetum coccineum]